MIFGRSQAQAAGPMPVFGGVVVVEELYRVSEIIPTRVEKPCDTRKVHSTNSPCLLFSVSEPERWIGVNWLDVRLRCGPRQLQMILTTTKRGPHKVPSFIYCFSLLVNHA
jgi:hypothetical protein